MNWKSIFEQEYQQPYFKQLTEALKEESKQYDIYPPQKDILNAFKYCPFDDVRVVLLAMDPYPTPGIAHGLAFSVNYGIKIPASLQNIYKELKSDLNIEAPNHGCLIDWAKQGVLLINSALTVRQGQPGSHQDIGWQHFTNKIISLINEKEAPIVFILWGAFARRKKSLILGNQHLVIESVHPSPMSANTTTGSDKFFGSKPFSKSNDFLIKNNIQPIDWELK